MKKRIWGIVSIALAVSCVTAFPATRTATITEAQLMDKIMGGWAGQMIGVTVGGPTEFRAQSELYTKPIVWDPKKVSDAIHQDDLYVEMTFAHVMDEEGLDAKPEAYGKAFAQSQYHLWHANFYARQLLRNGIMPPQSGHPEFNPHADDIDFQIESEFIGLMCPGLPATSNEFCDRVGHVMNYGDGVYGGMFVCAMYAVAFFEDDIEKVVQAGIAALPEESEYHRSMKDVYDWYKENPNDWKQVWQLFEDKWANYDICPQGTDSRFDIDAKTNGAYIAIGLLYGKKDFKQTVDISTMCGQDSDCNPASAAGILGVILGYKQLPGEWTTEIEKIKNEKFSHTNYSFVDICESTLKRARHLIEENGGSAEGDVLTVFLQEPVPAKLEQWKQDQVSGRKETGDTAFAWTGEWAEGERGGKISNKSGAKVTFTFEGTGAMLRGGFSENAGIVKISLNGKELRTFDLYLPRQRFDSESIYHVMGLEPGKHSITIELTDGKNEAAKGNDLYIKDALIFDGAEKAKQNL